ncbi:alpha/beta hydrolase [Aggregicoccus sp. 17bor-14]|uniref:alpha/beta fold hydrolase n=1 Tax=Myxococcaceae TaxID=31 RepID=UPI00129CF5E7|nr:MULTISPECIES: alpha/beta hydrolase [Myxococcaceae]MBF5045070.1 alpha/beta hydrolase [Simulacricoccus sp. 17bor-14]MRI90812.1 alpha/beta hydrolase [Aggregicoccus sp. 17bor-14]
MPSLQTSDGTRLAYEDYGSGPVLVFVSSWALNADMWEYQVPFFLERGYRCVLLDRRGHGRSERPSRGYDVDTGADDLAALLAHLDLRGVTLVGHSVGGAEAARYLARHGEARVARVAFVSALLPFLKQTPDNPEGLPALACDATIAQFHRDRPRWFADRAQGFFATHLGNDVSPALIEHTLRQCLSASPVATSQLFRSAFETDHRSALRDLRLPTLVLHGGADQSTPLELTGRRTAALVRGAELKVYPTAGHGLFVTHREQLNADLLAWMEG